MPKLPEPGNNPIFPSGTYRVRIASFEKTEAKTGTPQIRWKAEILAPEEHTGRTLVEHTALTDAAVWKVSNLIGACGLKFQPNIDTSSSYFTELCQATVGRTALWRNQEGVDNKGNPRNNIVGFVEDKDQDPIEFTPDKDEPAFLKDKKDAVNW